MDNDDKTLSKLQETTLEFSSMTEKNQQCDIEKLSETECSVEKEPKDLEHKLSKPEPYVEEPTKDSDYIIEKLSDNTEPERDLEKPQKSLEAEYIERNWLEELKSPKFSHMISKSSIDNYYEGLKKIPLQTLAELVSRPLHDGMTTYKIIDCRFPYEYNDGHIKGAFNLYTKPHCIELLFNKLRKNYSEENVLILYCEYSTKRSLNFFHYLREQDCYIQQKRQLETLIFPKVCILEGGYNTFFAHYSTLCVPQGYRKMWKMKKRRDLIYYNLHPEIWQNNMHWNYEGLSKDSARAKNFISMFF